MKFLKKPIFIKKIRSYNNNIKLTNFSIENKPIFVPKNNIVKSSYLEKVIDLGNVSSSIYMKGGYFYFNKLTNKSTYFISNKNEFIDSYFLSYSAPANIYVNKDIKVNLIKNYFNFIINSNNKSFFFLYKNILSHSYSNNKVN